MVLGLSTLRELEQKYILICDVSLNLLTKYIQSGYPCASEVIFANEPWRPWHDILTLNTFQLQLCYFWWLSSYTNNSPQSKRDDNNLRSKEATLYNTNYHSYSFIQRPHCTVIPIT